MNTVFTKIDGNKSLLKIRRLYLLVVISLDIWTYPIDRKPETMCLISLHAMRGMGHCFFFPLNISRITQHKYKLVRAQCVAHQILGPRTSKQHYLMLYYLLKFGRHHKKKYVKGFLFFCTMTFFIHLNKFKCIYLLSFCKKKQKIISRECIINTFCGISYIFQ